MDMSNLPSAIFDQNKAIAAITYLLRLSGNTCDKYWLNKVLYYIERESLIRTAQPMFFDELFSLPFGPIVSAINDGIDSTAYDATSPWSACFQLVDKKTIKLIKDANYDIFSPFEEELIKDIFQKFKGLSFKQMHDFFHALPENKETTSRITISYQEILQHNNFKQDEIESILQEIQYFSSLKVISSNAPA